MRRLMKQIAMSERVTLTPRDEKNREQRTENGERERERERLTERHRGEETEEVRDT
eukprot:COSAG05_NODE_10872_length_541_cov_37.270313_1_plen_55_part_01